MVARASLFMREAALKRGIRSINNTVSRGFVSVFADHSPGFREGCVRNTVASSSLTHRRISNKQTASKTGCRRRWGELAC